MLPLELAVLDFDLVKRLHVFSGDEFGDECCSLGEFLGDELPSDALGDAGPGIENPLSFGADEDLNMSSLEIPAKSNQSIGGGILHIYYTLF